MAHVGIRDWESIVQAYGLQTVAIQRCPRKKVVPKSMKTLMITLRGTVLSASHLSLGVSEGGCRWRGEHGCQGLQTSPYTPL